MKLSRRKSASLLVGVAAAALAAVVVVPAASAATACTAQSPCLPLNLGWYTTLPQGDVTGIEGNTTNGNVETLLNVWNKSTDTFSSAVSGSSGGVGVEGTTMGTTHLGAGVLGEHYQSVGASPGVRGITNSTADQASGVLGEINGTTSGSYAAGVRAHNHTYGTQGAGLWASHSGGGDGVYATSVDGIGVDGIHVAGTGAQPGIQGWTASNSPDASGVYGWLTSNAANAAGVRGYNASAQCCGMGVAGFHAGQGIGVYGEAQNGFAVSGFSPNNWSGYFQGSVNVVGTLYKSSGAFRIDNPIDPAHSYLQHSFVESPDMKNVYDGVVTTNGKGFATVKLPNWFQALNKDFRYQLTVMGRSFAQAIVWEELAHNQFTIKTNEPKVKLSWQVTGIRKDRYANAHRIQTVVPKTRSADGKYVHPELYGKPLSKSVVVLPGMKQRWRDRIGGVTHRPGRRE